MHLHPTLLPFLPSDTHLDTEQMLVPPPFLCEEGCMFTHGSGGMAVRSPASSSATLCVTSTGPHQLMGRRDPSSSMVRHLRHQTSGMVSVESKNVCSVQHGYPECVQPLMETQLDMLGENMCSEVSDTMLCCAALPALTTMFCLDTDASVVHSWQ
jgi:hypothetical protein